MFIHVSIEKGHVLIEKRAGRYGVTFRLRMCLLSEYWDVKAQDRICYCRSSKDILIPSHAR